LVCASKRLFRCLACQRTPTQKNLDSIVQFDVYFNVAAIGATLRTSSSDFYPNFSLYYSQRSDPALRQLIEDANLRSTVFDGTENQLAASLRALLDAAATESSRYSGWSGVYDPVVTTFLAEHPEVKSSE
jgi:hypothetical protein